MRIKHHISLLSKKILTPVVAIPVLLLGIIFVYALNTWDTGYEVAKYSVKNILGGGGGAYCLAIDNQCPIGTGIFVPTYSDAEWFGLTGFIYKHPSCVNLLPCACKTDTECGSYKCVGYTPAAGGTPATCTGSFVQLGADACNSENANHIMSKTVSGVEEFIEFTNIAWRPWFESQGYSNFSNVATKLGCAGINGVGGGVCASRSFVVSKFYQTNTYTYESNITRSCYGLKKNDRAECVTIFTDYASCTAKAGCSWVPQVGGSVEVMGHCGAPDGCKTNTDCLAGKVCSGYVAATTTSTTSFDLLKSTYGVNLGSIWSWGRNEYGQLGNGTTTNSSVPVQVSGLTNVLYLGNPGWGHSCALLSDGTVKCWGYGSNGQLGNGTTTNSSVPVQVSSLTNVTQLSVGSDHTCALLNGGTVKCWGYNGYGELGNGTTTNAITPVQVSNLTNVTNISLGFRETFSCALLTDSTVKCWGNNQYGQLGNGTTTNSSLPVQVSNLTNVADLSPGYISDNICALLKDGTVKCWGKGTMGELGNGTTTNSSVPVQVSGLTNVSQLSAGSALRCALLKDGTVKCWGDKYITNSSYGSLGNGTNNGSTTPVQVSNLTGVISLSLRNISSNACALLTGGSVKCWGRNEYGQLGNGTTTNALTPTQVSNLTNVYQLSIGPDSSRCALLSDGTVKCWGRNQYGQLGNNTIINSSVPVVVSTLSILFPNTTNGEILGQCVTPSCTSNANCTDGKVCNGYVPATNTPSVCLHWEKNSYELNNSIQDAEMQGQGCVAGPWTDFPAWNPLSYNPAIPARPSYAPSSSGQIANLVNVYWAGILYRSCQLQYAESQAGGNGNVWRESVATPAASCATQTSNGVTCTATSCTFKPATSTPAIPGQCVIPPCTSNAQCTNGNVCVGYVAPVSLGYCDGTFSSTVTTQGTCSYVGRCGSNPGCSSYTTQSSCQGPSECNGPAGECDGSCFQSYQACAWTDGTTTDYQDDCGQAFRTESECRSEPQCFWDAGTITTPAVLGQCMPPVINGSCGSSNATYLATAPTTNLCSAGTPSLVSGSGPWSWSCIGGAGGTTASCSAYKADMYIWECKPFTDGNIWKKTTQPCDSEGSWQFISSYTLNVRPLLTARLCHSDSSSPIGVLCKGDNSVIDTDSACTYIGGIVSQPGLIGTSLYTCNKGNTYTLMGK